MKHTDLKKIVLPEGGDERIIEAAKQLVYEGVCHPVLIGDPEVISLQMGYSDKFTVLPVDSEPLAAVKADAVRAGKQFPVEDAALVQGAALVRDGVADGIVAGAVNATTDVYRTYFKTIGVKEGVSRVTSCFLMEKGDSRLVFADCALNYDATADQHAETAYLSSEFAKKMDIEPKVAFTTFQTVGSAEHHEVQWAVDAAEVARETYKLNAVGPMQFDAAFVPRIAKSKMKESTIMGDATVHIFRNVEVGNVAYKTMQHAAGYQAIGPLSLGLNKPAHDLSRGCEVADVVAVAKVAVIQSS